MRVGFGRSLASLRSLYGISQAELAARAGVAQSTISDIESGCVDPKVTTTLKILRALDVSLVEVAMEDGEITLAPLTGAVSPGEADLRDLTGALTDGLAVVRGRSQLAEDRLRRQAFAALDDVLKDLHLIQAEVDRLSALVSLLHFRKV